MSDKQPQLQTRYMVFRYSYDYFQVRLTEPVYNMEWGNELRPFLHEGYDSLEEAQAAIIEANKPGEFVILPVCTLR